MVPVVRRTLQGNRLVSAGDAVVCAVSGGPDSMALLHVLARLSGEGGFSVTAAHVNHGFRPGEAEAEAETVRAFAASLGVPFRMAEVDAPGFAAARGMNAQAAARELRYRFLHETAVGCGARAIALGHHLDDQAETVLMHLLSGASLTGLAGMPVVQRVDGIDRIRPLLGVRKRDIVAYAKAQGIPWHEDSSNASKAYLRNRIRMEVMPVLLREQPALPEMLGRLADVAGEEDRFLDGLARQRLARLFHVEAGRVTGDRPGFVAEPVALQRRMIKLILSYLSGDPRFSDYTKIEAMRTAIEQSSPPSLCMDAGAGIRFLRRYDRIVWTLADGADAAFGPAGGVLPFDFEWAPERGPLAIPGVGVFHARFADRMDPGGLSPREAVFDADAVLLPLRVRSRRSGDRFEPYGLTGSKKVKDMFIDLKIDPDVRDAVPIVADADGKLLWIAGLRRSRHAPVDGKTGTVLHLRFDPEESSGQA